ncbi:AMP-binding protein, partial [Cribrihabitans sp. XS_ASV171]
VFTSPGLTEALEKAEAPGQRVDIAGADYAAARAHDPVAAPVARTAEDLCWLFYTSGTTGRPKGVMITNRMMIAMSLTYLADVDQATERDAVIYAAPMSHGAGIYNMLHVLVGARHVCPASGGFDEAEIFSLARHFSNVQMFAAPTMVRRMTDAAKATGETGEGLRTVVYAGGPMYLADIIEAVEHFGPVFVQIYGQGECPMGITALSRHDVTDRNHPRWRERLASVGRAQSTVEVAIGDAHGTPVPPGTHGEIMVRGDVVMPGYWQNAEATEKTLVGGWLMTGDMGFMDADGYLTMQDRSKDLIITGGSNVYPREVEEVLLTHPNVSEVSVVGRKHPEWGEEVVAFVVGRAQPEELDRLCIENIARFKRPKAYIPVESLPKNNYGKVLKTELRRMLEEGT